MSEVNGRRIVLVGASGLIGRAVIAATVGRSAIRLTALARREFALPPGARMELLVADPAEWPGLIASAQADALVIALGTTWRAAGRSEAAFRAVDQQLVLDCAGAAKAAGVPRCIVVSSVGADAVSRNFYLRVKGEVEAALAALEFDRLDILRPGLLRGSRGDDRRPGERLAILASPFTDLLLHGGLRRYRSVSSATVAKAILALSTAVPRGRLIHEHNSILAAAD